MTEQDEDLIGRLKRSQKSLAGRLSRPKPNSLTAMVGDRRTWENVARKINKAIVDLWRTFLSN